MNESEEIEEIKTFPIYPYLLQGLQALPNCKPISIGHLGDVRYTTPLPHPTTPNQVLKHEPFRCPKLLVHFIAFLLKTTTNTPTLHKQIH